MKKLFLALAMVFTMMACAPCSAMTGSDRGGIFRRGPEQKTEQVESDRFPGLPGHGETGDQPAPVGSGILALTILGGAYLVERNLKNLESNETKP